MSHDIPTTGCFYRCCYYFTVVLIGFHEVKGGEIIHNHLENLETIYRSVSVNDLQKHLFFSRNFEV